MKRIDVSLGDRSYPVLVAQNCLPELVRRCRQLAGKAKLFLFLDARFYALHGERVVNAFGRSAHAEWLVVPSGELTKSETHLGRLHSYVLSRGITRDDLIVAIGGGVTTDLVGYVAATVLRGVRWVAVPTTLLGMIDAGIGGKTGINHRSGKNLIGAFWQPKLVLSDLNWLHTLPDRQIVAGVGEMLKYAGLAGGKLLDRVEQITPNRRIDVAALGSMIAECARIKADCVSRDEREAGVRMHLNLGHTVAHAIERAQHYRGLLHGEAVILGLCAALEVSCQLAPRTPRANTRFGELVNRWVRVLPRYRLDRTEILTACGVDKKRRGSDLRMVLLAGPGKPRVASRVPTDLLSEAIAHMLTVYRARRT